MKRKLPLDHFSKGLQDLGILDLIHKYPESMKVFFIQEASEDLNPERFLKLSHNINSNENVDANERARLHFINAIHQLYAGQ